jgi:hypothetical protein
MSNAHPPSHDAPAGNGDDGVNMKLIVGVGVVSLVVFAASAVVAGLVLRSDEATYAERGIAPRGSEIGKPEINLVDQVTFDDDKRLPAWRAEKARLLDSYGWADRKRGLVHIPISEAMRQVVREAARGGGGAPAGEPAEKKVPR